MATINNRMKAYTRLEITLGFAVLVILVAYAASLTKQSFKKAEENYNKSQIFTIGQALNTMTENGDNLSEAFSRCVNAWCDVNETLQAKIVNDNTDPASPILPDLVKTSNDKLFQLKVTGASDYIVQGVSASDGQKCWIIYSDSSKSNTLQDQPTQCLSY